MLNMVHHHVYHDCLVSLEVEAFPACIVSNLACPARLPMPCLVIQRGLAPQLLRAIAFCIMRPFGEQDTVITILWCKKIGKLNPIVPNLLGHFLMSASGAVQRCKSGPAYVGPVLAINNFGESGQYRSTNMSYPCWEAYYCVSGAARYWTK